GLEKQRRLADAGIAAQEQHAAGDEASPRHAVEFGKTRGDALVLARLDPRQRRHRRANARDVLEAHGRWRGDGLDERVPRAALRTLPLPLGRGAAAFGAADDRFWLC